MARIEPFKGVRPVKNLASKVASPPYDVLNTPEAKELCIDNPFSFLHITRPEVDLPEGVDLYADEVYAKAKENFEKFLKEGILIQDKEKYFYLYRQIWGEHTQTGLVAGASCQDYQDDVIKKHELTREDKEKDRMRLIETLDANSEPVFLTFKHRRRVDDIFTEVMKKEPEYDFMMPRTAVRHIFWVISEPEWIKELKDEFSKIDLLYVADGHHRSAAATNVKILRQKANPHHTGDEEYNFFLTVIFPDNQMKILPYNRVVKDLNGMCKAEFFGKVAEKFDYIDTEDKVPPQSGEFRLYIEGKWYKLTPKVGTFDPKDPVGALDVSILQNNLLNPILGIENPRKDKRIDFVGGIRGASELEKLVNSGKFAVAISFYPTTIDQLFSVADAGQIMPPKSTWFEPKLESGLTIHLFND